MLSIFAIGFAVLPILWACVCVLAFVIFAAINIILPHKIGAMAVILPIGALMWFPIVLFGSEFAAAICALLAFLSTARDKTPTSTTAPVHAPAQRSFPNGIAQPSTRIASQRWPYAMLAAMLLVTFLLTCAFLLSLMIRDPAFRSALARMIHFHP
jgi:hypothetical protein